MKFIKDILTGVDGQTYDNIRVYMLIGVAGFLAATGYTLYQGKAFDWQSFGLGYAGILAAGGAGIGLKAKTEPGGGQ